MPAYLPLSTLRCAQSSSHHPTLSLHVLEAPGSRDKGTLEVKPLQERIHVSVGCVLPAGMGLAPMLWSHLARVLDLITAKKYYIKARLHLLGKKSYVFVEFQIFYQIMS